MLKSVSASTTTDSRSSAHDLVNGESIAKGGDLLNDVEEVTLGLLKCRCREDDCDIWRTVAVCESLGTAERIAEILNALSTIEQWKAEKSGEFYDPVMDAIYFSK